ncbi:hypothetical protein L1047_03355 [Synechococcus sp. Nb3U1]|uniref:hypothetical protein n=1 Tax=Synechococcus sp. Nb3U1 TaxID=1914529 RepID=UPI001F3D06DA|nr:hypothetical protein [Synechococcus sp. Nb3U1]MCF2970231.1 hypothetical protein [Synechococcus sp. Nb3U1]
MKTAVDPTLDYRAYRLAALLNEHLELGELRGISLMWQTATSPEPTGVSSPCLSLQQIEQRYLTLRQK